MIARLRALKAKEIIRVLRKNGFELVRINGSHHYFRKPNSQLVCVPEHKGKALAPGTFQKIRSDSGLSYEDFMS